jgi:hypothetical protein
LTENAYLALLEVPFADSILKTDLFQTEMTRLRNSGAARGRGMMNPAVQNSLEILGKLKDRLAENRKKFPWKILSSFAIQNLSSKRNM